MLGSDQYNITRILQYGEVSKYAILVEKYKDLVFNVAYRMTGNFEDAEELSQDAFVKAFQSLENFKGESKFSTWLYSIVHNLSISKLRKKKLDLVEINETTEERIEESDSVNGIELLNLADQRECINEVLQLMDPLDRMLITLYYYEDMSVKEMEEVVELSSANIKVKLHRLRKKMFSDLKRILQNELNSIR